MPVPSSLLTSRPADLDLEVTAGHWPADLTGEMVISSPLPDPSLEHGFFGFGVMNRLSLVPGTNGASAGRLAWRPRVIDSPSRRLYEAVPAAFTPGPTGFTTPLGSPNMANTAPLPWGDRLFATWDVGRPSEIDPLGLNWLGDVGSVDGWGGQSSARGAVFPFLFSTAHPVIDPERDCLWTVKLTPDFADGFRQDVSLVRWNRDARDVETWPIEGARIDGTMHTIAQTQHWLVLSDSGNFKADPGAMLGEPRSVRVDEEVNCYLVRKDQVDSTPPGQPLKAVPMRVGPPPAHYYGVWDDSDGVRVIIEHMDLIDLGFPLAGDDLDRNGQPIDPALRGFYSMSLAPSTVSEVVLDPDKGKVLEQAHVRDEWSWSSQLSAIDWSTEGMAKPTLHHLAYHGCRPGAISRRAIDYYADRLDESRIPTSDTPGALVSFGRGSLDERARWDYPDTSDFITSPTFAPRNTASLGSRYLGEHPGGHDGYVVLPVQNDAGFRVEVFDAADVSRGPVAVASAPGGATVPVLLHSAWMPRAVNAPAVERRSFADDLGPLGGADDEVATAVRRIADDLS